MKIKDLPDDSKPRERMLKHGASTLSEAELLAIILRTGTKKQNVIDMSAELLKKYPLSSLFDCSFEELKEVKGIKKAKALQLLAISELGKRYSQAKTPIKKITCAKDVFDLFHARLRDEKQEHFIVLMLNTKNNIIREETVFKGTLDSSVVHPREIFKAAIKNSAAKIILVHNHPSGDPTPSEDDLFISNKLLEGGKLLNINIIDHVIVSGSNYWSWKMQEI
ncbi:MAG: JAB domain-containing protein [Candidatus Staskawiczbacteria bacterium]|nr:JAB domain-containing protein [Candidatus Staskawiczbacteria bacterium]